jgi:uroporphyrinogen-III decarboxylase
MATREEINGAKMQKTFVLPHLMAMRGIANWPDARVPIDAQVNEYVPEVCRLPYEYLFRDAPRAMAECSLLAWEYTGIDYLEANMDIYDFEAENAGSRINFYPDHLPDTNRRDFLIKEEKDLDKIKFRGLDHGRCRYLIEYCHAWTEYSGVDVFPVLCAPWSIASNLYGLENLVVAAMTEPEFVHEMFRRIVYDLQVPMYKALMAEIPGCVSITLADAWASPPVVSVPLVREFVAAWHLRCQEAMGMRVVNMGIWGNSFLKGADKDEFHELIKSILGMITVFDPDLEKDGVAYYRQFSTKAGVPLVEGLSNSLLLNGPVDAIVKRAKTYVLEGKAGPTPLLILLNNIGPRTPIDHIRAAVAAINTYGAPGATETTSFQLPPPGESFGDFLKKKIQNNVEGYRFEWLEKSGWAKEVKLR